MHHLNFTSALNTYIDTKGCECLYQRQWIIKHSIFNLRITVYCEKLINVDTSEVRKSKSVFILFYNSMTEASSFLLWSCEYDLDQNNEYVVRMVSYPHFNWYRKQKVIYNVIWFRLITLRIYPTIDWSRNIWYIYYFKVNPLLVKFNPLRRLYNIIYLQFFTNKNWC